MWARISIFLVAALIAATAGGAWMGYVLNQQAPRSPTAAAADAVTTQAIQGQGDNAIPEPPQPRVDGSLGVPVRTPALQMDSVPMVSILEDENLNIAASAAAPAGQDDLEALLRRADNFPIPGLDPVAPQPPAQAPQRAELPPELAFAVALPADAPAPGPAWRETLRASLARCDTQRYFSKRECEQRLRIQHCDPNSGWGQVPECPSYLRNTRY